MGVSADYMCHVPIHIRRGCPPIPDSLGAVEAGVGLTGGPTLRRHDRHFTPCGIGLGGRFLMAPAVHIRLVQARLSSTGTASGAACAWNH